MRRFVFKKIYVDKTALICQLASRAEKFFLTRPRRFGKSLLISTFASLFRDGLKHFSGLAIEKLWKDKTYNVVEIDFSEIKNFSDLSSDFPVNPLNDTKLTLPLLRYSVVRFMRQSVA